MVSSKGITESALALALVLLLWNGAAAQSSCAGAVAGLMPCLSFITGLSSTPASNCCNQLNLVVQTQPQCICALINSGAAMTIPVNQTLALTLPGACNLQTSPLNQCNAANGPTSSAASPETAPVGSPTGSPASGSTDETPETTETPSESQTPEPGTGSKTVPSTTGGSSSGGSATKSPFHAVLAVLFVVSLVSVTSF